MRLSKGVHVLVDGGEDWDAALTISHDKVRVSFAVPWEGMLLLGTTDTEHDGEPEDARVTDEDVQQVLTEASVAVTVSARRARRSAACASCRAVTGRRRTRAARRCTRPARRGWSASRAAS